MPSGEPTAASPSRPPSVSECFNGDAISDLIVWNAPDHEHTRLSLRRQLEQELDEAFGFYEAMGGDRANLA